jgi:hypothetical protein
MVEVREKLPIYTLDEVRAAFDALPAELDGKKKWVGWNTLAFALCPRKSSDWHKLAGENWSPGYDRWERTVYELRLPVLPWNGMRLIGMPEEAA